ncbi:regulator of microtubule dynamics protein 1-like [Dendronephthya gigantea]|uniref:regulator of microtubule dynamics protein 1-like n=1 Tax=Dendronephthya gigantea TaxID=151771 RepID=UPI00106B18A5|nr:regulator of microtubule dynamics protein 1-like [Dendronephthya gigantea]
MSWMNKVKRVVFSSRLIYNTVLGTRYLKYWKFRQVVPRLQRFARHFLTPVPPLLALSLFGWKSEDKMEATNLESGHIEEEAIKHADKLYQSKEDKESNEVEVVKNLFAYLSQYKDCSNAGLLWRLARAARDLATLSVTDETSKKSLTYEAHEYAKRALACDEENFACHKWYAITLSRIGDYEGTKQKISNAYIIQNHFKRAIELNPLDPTCYHLLGRWCFTVADVPWYQRKIASAIFDTPPSSSYEEALDYFERAERLEPNFYTMNQLMIVKCYLRLNKKTEARSWLEKLLIFNPKTEEDTKTVEEAKELRKSC